MKKLNKIFLYIPLVCMFLACEDEDKNPFPLNVLEQAAVLREISKSDDLTINKSAPGDSNIEVTVEADDFQNNTRFESMDIFVSFVDTFVDREDETDTELDDEDVSIPDVLLRTIPASAFSPGGTDGKPQYTLNVNGEEAIAALNLEPVLSRVDGGDIIRIRLAMNLNDGSVFTSTNVNGNVTGQFFASPFRYDATVVCILPPPAGDYTVVMQDSYGDGWQTSNGSGGPGITISLSNGDEIQVGLCSPYETPSYACTPGVSQGTATVTIPEGLESADWSFPGDFYGEISFQIFAPSGNQIASYDTGAAAGPIPLNLCNE